MKAGNWQPKYGHPVLAVESFVDLEQFCGTVYTANGWQELGLTDGWGRCGRDYYVKHGKPKRLFVEELCKNARRSLQAQHLKETGLVHHQRDGSVAAQGFGIGARLVRRVRSASGAEHWHPLHVSRHGTAQTVPAAD